MTRLRIVTLSFALGSLWVSLTARANPAPPQPPPDPDCTPEREHFRGWGECRYCPLAPEDRYDTRNLDLPDDYEPDPDECRHLTLNGYRYRCRGERDVFCRRAASETPPGTSHASGCACSAITPRRGLGGPGWCLWVVVMSRIRLPLRRERKRPRHT